MTYSIHTDSHNGYKQQQEALDEIDVLLLQNRPRHLVEGITSGVGYILAGAIGAAGILILSPHVAAKHDGASDHDWVGRVVDGVMGTAVGAYSAVSVATGGILSGVLQIGRGLINTPASLIEPRKGKWWNVNEGIWMETHLQSQAKWIRSVPEYDQDILGETALPEAIRLERQAGSKERAEHFGVTDTKLYDIVGVDPDASMDEIHRRFAQLVKCFNPNRAGAESSAARQKLKEIANAYAILTNERTRQQYDATGEVFTNYHPLIDPDILYTTLYGNEAFDPYIGRLAVAAEALMKVERLKQISFGEARELQRRRTTRLALQLADRLQSFVQGKIKIAEEVWKSEAGRLCGVIHGAEIVHLIGAVYAATSACFLGSLEAGIGMPSIAKWAHKQRISAHLFIDQRIEKLSAFMGDNEAREAKILNDADNLSSQDNATDENLYNQLGKDVLNIFRTKAIADISSTVNEACEMVLYDLDVNAETRKMRGQALGVLGGIFQQALCETTPSIIETQQDYDRIAFVAVLETVRNREIAAYNASINHRER